MKFFIWAMVFIIVSSCASMSKEECTSMNWSAKGREDAYEGESLNMFSKYHKFCSNEYGINISKERYVKGYSLGLESFCTPQRGETFGHKGGVYKGQCPKNRERDFLKAYNLAFREYKLQQKEEELANRERELRERVEAMSAQQAEMAQSTGKACSFDNDCRIENSCRFSRCELTGKACSFSSDCEIEGDCRFNRCVYGR